MKIMYLIYLPLFLGKYNFFKPCLIAFDFKPCLISLFITDVNILNDGLISFCASLKITEANQIGIEECLINFR